MDENEHRRSYESFSELRSEAQGVWNKIRLTARYTLLSIARFPGEYLENATAVIGNVDPSAYNAEREQRHEQMIAKLGQWAVEREIIA